MEKTGIAKINLVRDLIVGEDIKIINEKIELESAERRQNHQDLAKQIVELKEMLEALKKSVNNLSGNKVEINDLKGIFETLANKL